MMKIVRISGAYLGAYTNGWKLYRYKKLWKKKIFAECFPMNFSMVLTKCSLDTHRNEKIRIATAKGKSPQEGEMYLINPVVSIRTLHTPQV
jgi:hypothetical protein